MDKTYTLKARSVIRPLALLPLIVGLSLAFAATASAQTTVASVDNVATHGPGNPGPICPDNNAFYCGDANVPGYGPAFWSFTSPGPPSGTPAGSDCFTYNGTSTFTFANGSRLVFNEYGVLLCHPGNSGNTPNFWGNPQGGITQGHPNRGGGTWSVCTKATADPSIADPTKPPTTGCGFPDGNSQPLYSTDPSLTGSGTDWLQTNGAILTATWVGTMTPSS
jgi:hypothetical protein